MYGSAKCSLFYRTCYGLAEEGIASMQGTDFVFRLHEIVWIAFYVVGDRESRFAGRHILIAVVPPVWYIEI